MTITLLVQMISIVCIENNTRFLVPDKNGQGFHYDTEKSQELKLDCFDHFNNCMVGPGGAIKASDWKVCKKSWEKKNK